MRKIFIAFILTFLIFSSALAETSEDNNIIRVGVFDCLTGSNAYGGKLEVDGIKLANKLNPEILGKKIELIIIDNKSDKLESVKAVDKLINEYKVCAILGSYGSAYAMAGGEVAERAKIPVVGSSCTNPLVTLGKEYYFRACFVDTFQGEGAAGYAYKNLNLRRAAILTDFTNDYSVGLGRYFANSFKKLGGEVVISLMYHPEDGNFREPLKKIISENPDVLFLPSYFEDGIIILNQARELGAKFKIIGGDAMDNPEIIKYLKDDPVGFIYTIFAYDPSMEKMNPEAEKFTREWKNFYPDKEPSSISALGYDSYLIFMVAVNMAQSFEPQKIRDALEEIYNLPTVTGITTINKNHDAEKALGIIEIKNGKKRFLGTIEPE